MYLIFSFNYRMDQHVEYLDVLEETLGESRNIIVIGHLYGLCILGSINSIDRQDNITSDEDDVDDQIQR